MRKAAGDAIRWPSGREGGRVKTEDDPLDPAPPSAQRRTLEAIRYLETALQAADDLETVGLRYGMLESLLIRARSLVEFLFDNTRNVRAEHYFVHAQTWREGRGKRPEALKDSKLTHLVGREIAHVTEHRASLVGGGSPWPHFAGAASAATRRTCR